MESLGLLLCYRIRDRDWHLGHLLTSSMGMLHLCLVEHLPTSETGSIDSAGSGELAGRAGVVSYCPQCYVIEQEMGREKSATSSSQNWAFGEALAGSHCAVHLLSCREMRLIAAVAAYVLSEHQRGMSEVVYDCVERQRRRLMTN